MNKQALDRSVDFIKSWLSFRYEREEIPGFSVAIAHKGQLLLHESYGYADLEKKIKLTPEYTFRIASHSKTFTATAIMQLQEQGKLRIDDKAVEYLEWLQDHKDDRWKQVTIRQLLSHSAGVIRDGHNADFWQLERAFPNEDELKKEVLEAELVISTNVKMKYSNFGYSLLGLIVQAASGEAYNEYVSRHIVEPLQLNRTGPELTDEAAGHMVTGYSRKDADRQRLPIAPIDTKAMSPATGFYSTAEDLCRYFSAHLVASGNLLDDESKKEMQRPQYKAETPGSDERIEYGLGFEISYLGGMRLIGHGGGFPGQTTQSWARSDDELVVVVLTNCLGSRVTSIAKGIYGVIDYFQNEIQEPNEELFQYEGRYMDLWSMTQIITSGNKLLSAYPDSWTPFQSVEVLEHRQSATFRITKTGSFMSEGELVRFNMHDGQTKTVTYAGTTMWPERDWLDKQRTRQIIG